MAGPGVQTDPALEEARERILDAALAHVAFDGWGRAALAAGAADAGYDADTARRAFLGGGIEAALHHSARADTRMLAALEELALDDMGTTATVAAAVRLRLEQNADDREAVRRALPCFALPGNAPHATRALYRTVDAIWHAAGDRSTDHNFYTKRGLLAAVYGATLLHWLDDKSEGFADTWAFLDRRLAEVLAVPVFFGHARRLVGGLPSPIRLLRAGAKTARARRPFGGI
jgi:ubiquinone biosynthesis protein COQ9